MISSFKRIVLQMARLRSADQRWILRHLSATQREKFERQHGLRLLQEAQRFQVLKPNDTNGKHTPPNPWPTAYARLSNKHPLYAAIVLKQSTYPWLSQFLQHMDTTNAITNAMNQTLTHLKPLTQQAVMDDWHNRLSFDDYLEDYDGTGV